MPVKVIKYTCAFKCGARANKSYNNMVGHEESCWNNPVNQTCNTCANKVYEYDDDGFNKSYYRGCKISALSNILESAHEVMSYQNSVHVRPVYNCPYHNKEADDKTEAFAEELFDEITGEKEGTKHYPFYNKPVKRSTEANSDDVPW